MLLLLRGEMSLLFADTSAAAASEWVKKMFANSLVVKKKKMTEISWCCCCRVDCACRYIIMIVNNASR
jgi:hypothetical protein